MRHPEHETWITTLGIDFRYFPAVQLAQIRIEDEAHNQVRGATDEDRVLVYAEARQAGADFPAVVLWMNGHGSQYEIEDGYHRTFAAKIAEVESIDAYVLAPQTTPLQRMALRTTFNARNGLPLTRTEALEQALHLVANGFSHHDAALAAQVSRAILAHVIEEKRTRERFAKLGLDDRADRFAVSSLRRLGNIRGSETLRATVEALTSFGPNVRIPVEEVDALVRAVNKTDTEEAAHKVTAEWRHTHAHLKASTVGGARRDLYAIKRLERVVAAVRGIDVGEVRKQPVAEAHRTQLRGNCAKAAAHLQKIGQAIRV